MEFGPLLRPCPTKVVHGRLFGFESGPHTNWHVLSVGRFCFDMGGTFVWTGGLFCFDWEGGYCFDSGVLLFCRGGRFCFDMGALLSRAMLCPTTPCHALPCPLSLCSSPGMAVIYILWLCVLPACCVDWLPMGPKVWWYTVAIPRQSILGYNALSMCGCIWGCPRHSACAVQLFGREGGPSTHCWSPLWDKVPMCLPTTLCTHRAKFSYVHLCVPCFLPHCSLKDTVLFL